MPIRRMRPAAPATAPLPGASNANPAPLSVPVVTPVPTPNLIRDLGEIACHPMWYRFREAANVSHAGNTSIELFDKRKNQFPHLTNAEEAQTMPSTSEFYVAAIEIVPNPGCHPGAFQRLLTASRLVFEVGAKGYEQINAPAVLFHSAGAVPSSGGLDNSTGLRAGIYTLTAGEEIKLASDQPFRVRLVLDDQGFATGNGETLDVLCVLRGQKRSKVSIG